MVPDSNVLRSSKMDHPIRTCTSAFPSHFLACRVSQLTYKLTFIKYVRETAPKEMTTKMDPWMHHLINLQS